MTDAVAAIVYNESGNVSMIILPDYPEQLEQKAFNPDGHYQVKIVMEDYKKANSALEVSKLVLEKAKELGYPEKALDDKIKAEEAAKAAKSKI